MTPSSKSNADDPKPVYALTHILVGAAVVEPGDDLTKRQIDEKVLQGIIDRGDATYDQKEAEAALDSYNATVDAQRRAQGIPQPLAVPLPPGVTVSE